MIEEAGGPPPASPRQPVMHTTQQQLMQRYFEEVARQGPVCDRERRAAYAISACGTRALGAHVLSCPEGAYEQLQFHACRHRSCARCGAVAQQRWAEQELGRLLPCEHHHVVFTLAHELIDLWSYNRAEFTALLMRSAREALLQTLADPRILGAVPGIVLNLHTWGRNLSRHPHVHCLVSAGGVDARGRWRATRRNWLAPVKALRSRYKRLLLQGISQGLRQGWAPPEGSDLAHWHKLLKGLWRNKHWNIEISDTYEHGRGVVLYLARYAKGGPLPRSRPLELDENGNVSFQYQDHRSQRIQTQHLSAQQFVRRLLWHAPAPRQHTTRHAGLYNSNRREHYAQACAHLRQPEQPWPRPRTPATPTPATPCPHCGKSLLRTRRLGGLKRQVQRAHHGGEFSPQEADATAERGSTRRSNGPSSANSGRAPPSWDIVGSARPLLPDDGRSPQR